MSVMEIISKILDLIKSIFDSKSKKIEAENQKKKEKAEKERKEALKKDDLEKKKKEVSDAAYSGDVDKINEILNSCITIFFVLTFTLLSGCVSKEIIYVPTDRQVVKITYNEQEGYFVPKAVMAELLQYKIEAKYYKEKFENGIKSTEE